LFFLNFLLRIPFFNLPAHHDELPYFDSALKVFNNNLNPFIEFQGYKPPVFYELAAIFFKILSPARFWGRLISSLFSSFCLLFTYLLGKKLFSERTGFWAVLILCVFPLFLAQSFLYQPPALLTFLALATLYYYFLKKKFFYLVFATLLVLTHETTIFFVILLFFFNLWEERKNHGFQIKKSLSLLFPLIFFAIWTFLNKKYLGWFFWPVHFSLVGKNRVYPRNPLLDILNLAFKENFLWFVFSFIFFSLIFSIGYPKLKKKFIRKEILFFVFLFFFYVVIFYWLDFLPRYLLFLYPLILLTFVWFLEKFFNQAKRLSLFFMVGVLLIYLYINLYNLFFLPWIPWAGEQDLRFLRIVFLQKEAARYINSNFSDPIIVSVWPITQAFEKPFYGYVEKSLVGLYCGTEEAKIKIQELGSKEKYDNIILISSSIYDSRNCFIYHNYNYKLIKEISLSSFPKNDIKIYKLVKKTL